MKKESPSNILALWITKTESEKFLYEYFDKEALSIK